MKTKKVLVVVDMQNDFVHGVLGTPEAQSIIPAIQQKIRAAHDAGDLVIFTRDTHSKGYMGTREGKYLPVPHCIWGTDGWEIVSDLRGLVIQETPYLNDVILDKCTFGVSGEIYLDVIEEYGFSSAEFELCGVCTDICVISNAVILHTLYPEADITVDAKAVAGVTPEKNAAALEVMKSLQINVINE